MNSFGTSMVDYICSGHALLHVDTFEKDRAISEITQWCDRHAKPVNPPKKNSLPKIARIYDS